MTIRSKKASAIYVIATICAVCAAILGFGYWRLTNSSIRCWSTEYGPLNYVAKCQGSADEYERGAIYYDLESGISEAIKNAQVIFIGSSKLQQAFSTNATSVYFAERKISFYVLGFSAPSTSEFAVSVLKRSHASPTVLIVNAGDPFFRKEVRVESNIISGGLNIYWHLAKRASLQRLQREICPSFPSFCSPRERTIYRSATTGQWRWKGSYYQEQSIPFNELLQDEFSDDAIQAEVNFGDRSLRAINIDRNCIVFTGVPNNKLDAPAIASRLAQRLGTQVILPNVKSLFLLDDLHLNFDTAERWSAAFLTALTPILQRCLPKENQGAF